MKSARQVREWVRRRSLEESRIVQKYIRDNDAFWPRSYARTKELCFIEVLNAFDTAHKTPLKMPKLYRRAAKQP